MHGFLIALIVEEVLKTCPTFDFPNGRLESDRSQVFSSGPRPS